MRRALQFLAVTAVLAIAGIPLGAQAEDSEAYSSEYEAGTYGRVRYLEDGATIVRMGSEERPGTEDAATGNAPIFPGDVLRTGPSQRTEIQLASGTVVRVDRGSEVDFLSLPDPYAGIPDNTVLKLVRGTLQFSPRLRDQEEFRIDTSAASVYLLGEGNFRIEVDDRGRTRVLSRRGVAEVVGEGGSVLVRSGARTFVLAGSVPAEPQAFNTFAEDSFDQWVAAREDAYRVRETHVAEASSRAYDEIPSEVRPYYNELAAYGQWVYAPEYGYAWYPYDSGPGWRPYLDGYWEYGPGGYFWVADEPWGWAPYHYGRWTWVPGYGWCWLPGRIFGGAWVAWYWGPAYVGWCPLDYWNRPAFYGTLYGGYYDPDCWTFVGYEHMAHHGLRRHAVAVHSAAPSHVEPAFVTRPPRVAPSDLARDPAARRRAVREASDDRRSRVAAVRNREVNPGRSFSDVERDVRQRMAGRAPSPTTRRGVPVSTDSDRSGRASRSTVGTTADGLATRPPAQVREVPTKTVPRRSRVAAPVPSAPDRSPVDSPSRSSSSAVTKGSERDGKNRNGAVQRQTRPTSPETARRGEANSGEGVREMYRRLASPRVTTERDTPSRRTQAATPAPAVPQDRHPTAGRSQPEKHPRAGASSQSSRPSPPAARDRGSQGSSPPPKRDRGSDGGAKRR